MLADTGVINKSEKGNPGQGKTTPSLVLGQRREVGPESYVEIKAPTMVGTRTSVPYNKVLPKYRERAEEALRRDSIPKQHEKRVKEYFESLSRQ
jgi:hypothetical protein